jgi:histidinol dehydrogenase
MNITVNPTRDNWTNLTTRPAKEAANLSKTISDVFDEVQVHGDKALLLYTKKFDKVALKNLKVSEVEIGQARSLLSQDLKDAIALAKKNIEIFHSSQLIEKQVVETTNGVECWQEMRPIEKVGLRRLFYVHLRMFLEILIRRYYMPPSW